MVRIRLARLGAKKKPFYRVVVADSRAPRDGAALEILGHYNPMTQPATVQIDLARADHWIGHGAQPSETVASLLKRARGVGVKDLVAYMVRGVVKHPDAVTVTETDGEASVLLELSVAPEDQAAVQGPEGATLAAIRAVLAASSGRRKAVLELLGA